MSIEATYARLQQAILHGSMDAADLIRPQGKLVPHERLAIYAEGYRIRMRKAVEDDYTALAYLMGRTRFQRLLNDFLEASPSHSFNLDRYSIGFGSFAASAASDRFESEIARLESAINDVYLREEKPALAPAFLASLPADALAELRLTIRHACVLMALSYPADAYLTEFREGANPTPPAPVDNWLAVVRHEHIVRRVKLEQAEYRMLQCFGQQQTLEQSLLQVAAELGTSPDRLAAQLQSWFTRWMEAGLLQA